MLTFKKNQHTVVHYFDRIRINIYFDRNHLLSIPELRDLFQKKIIYILDAYPSAQKGGYHSRIEVTAPTKDTLDIIEKAILACVRSTPRFSTLQNADDFMTISKVEIVRDFIVDGERRATMLADRLMDVTIKKHTVRFMLYDSDNSAKKKVERQKQKTNGYIFSKRTGYWGNKDRFEYVVYARFSKVNGLPCVHTEFRILGSYNIRRKTGINTFADLKRFDFKKYFEEMDQKFLTYEEIDKEAIGRWKCAIDGRRTLTKRQNILVELTGQSFCNSSKLNMPCRNSCRSNCQSLACEINSAPKLKQFLQQEEGKILNAKKKILSNEKSKFFKLSSITMSSLFTIN